MMALIERAIDTSIVTFKTKGFEQSRAENETEAEKRRSLQQNRPSYRPMHKLQSPRIIWVLCKEVFMLRATSLFHTSTVE
jgi:hypothetical protein